MTELLSLLVGLTAGFFIYRQGLRDGQVVKSDKPLSPLKAPFVMPKAEEVDKAEELLAQSWANMMAFDGSPQRPLKEGE